MPYKKGKLKRSSSRNKASSFNRTKKDKRSHQDSKLKLCGKRTLGSCKVRKNRKRRKLGY
tara:strand:- start:242 stop:421 length:180 start_codon:yes stop_codon:yes gene_type:complete